MRLGKGKNVFHEKLSEETAGTANLLVSSFGLFEQSEDTRIRLPDETARFFFCEIESHTFENAQNQSIENVVSNPVSHHHSSNLQFFSQSSSKHTSQTRHTAIANLSVSIMLLLPIYFLIFGTIELTAAFSSVGNSSTGAPTGDSLDDITPEPEIMARPFVEITNVSNEKESLPSSFIEGWPTWFLDTDGSLSRIPDGDSGDGYTNPTSIDVLFQP